MMAKNVVLCPFMGTVGHLLPMVELAKQFVLHGDVSVTLPVVTVRSSTLLVSKFTNLDPNISFHILPQIKFANFFNMNMKIYKDNLRSFLIKQSKISPISAIILDIICADALDVACELGIPAYFFVTSGAASLAVFLQLPAFLKTHSIGQALKETGTFPLLFHGVPPLLASDLPKDIFNPESELYRLLMNPFDRWMEVKGILVNSFESLEPRAVKALKDGLCLPNSTPTLYCIGPLIVREEKKEERHPCLSWLDDQPKGSVVFLCFGSMGSFTIEQLKEIAIGLENSGQRFLWVVRSPSTTNQAKIFEPSTEPDLDTVLLPKGFLDRTKDRGLVVKQWAPQVEVLQHESVGGFMSHCGWNSTLEAVSIGVPMICWPLYAEQMMNKVFLVEEMKIGIELKGYDKGFVRADEIEAKVKWILDQSSEGAMALRNKMKEVKERAANAMKKEGSSFRAIDDLLECLN
ncbi:hypothetical protein LUZ61_001493 [Rhynchospora tenuis]|uniref:Glycosyltransferase n=1 Tax=Rhynchospora tenuis TaxID=198213 RepID=A0AAD5ZH54_9POAL|nr:hypothetical protein LUZ61_001493 [Rhynchospora tenuis]